MRTELEVLLDKVEDAALAADLRTQVERIKAGRDFGLVFESHLPERVVLPDHTIRRGLKVVRRDDHLSPTFQVVAVTGGTARLRAVRDAEGRRLDPQTVDEAREESAPLRSLVVIADFGEPIHPGLRRLGSVECGGDKPAHVVIKAENHHALELLQFTHAGGVDCVYIDPPYNTGARDWKYDNDYVDENDDYRHSKWLAFMERRLLLAKKLLNPERSVLVVTIDEKEVHRLGLLLEQVFMGSRVQMVSITISPRGTSRTTEFSRVDEYAYFVFLGSAAVGAGQRGEDGDEEVRWQYLRRTQKALVRGSRPNQFYAIYVDPKTEKIVSVGQPLGTEDRLEDVPRVDGAVPVFPIDPDGLQLIWGLTPGTLRDVVDKGFVRVTKGNEHQPFTIAHLSTANITRVEAGVLAVRGTRPDGSKIVVIPGGKAERLSTVWRETRHDAGAYGTSLLRVLLPGRSFPFPKSLYAVEDTLRAVVGDNRVAVVLDFFAGSGTTAHAVARLNRQDGGRRQSVLVTNNEVSATEAAALREQGFRPGDPQWETLGIFEHVTRPRVTAAITGLTPSGHPVEGSYKFTDEFPMAEGFEENVEFVELTYLDPDEVELDMAFNRVAPLLWLRAGGRGPVLMQCGPPGTRNPYLCSQQYGVLFDTDRWRAFVEALPPTARTAFVVTDSPATFSGIVGELPTGLDVVRLYENYLSTFAINTGR